MPHPKLRQQQMLEWLRTADERREPFPSDNDIAEHFRLASAESARSLLADLADAGHLTLTGSGAERVITLGRKATTITTAVAAPPVRKPEALEVAKARTASPPPGRADTIRAIAAKLPPPATRKPGATMLPPAAAVQPTPPAPGPASVVAAPPAPVVTPPRVAEPEKAAERAGTRTWTPPPPAKRQISFTVPVALFDRLAAAAEAKDLPTGTYARELLVALLEGQTPALPEASAPIACARKPLVRAEMVVAAQRDGFPLDAFIRLLLERGFGSYTADVTAEMLAAAE